MAYGCLKDGGNMMGKITDLEEKVSKLQKLQEEDHRHNGIGGEIRR